jgi:replication initiation protein RepC
MERPALTTSFGRRPATLAQITAQMDTRRLVGEAAKPGSNSPEAVNKWQLFRCLATIRERLGLSDRTLGVLNALLSFHPETALTLPKDGGDAASCDLVVFPSNKALSQRAHGIAGTTLWRQLTLLVETGLILRRDSPNGKRYARKDASGKDRFSDAFGFDLTPLVARAAEFEAIAEDLARQRRAEQLLRERITLLRRDVGKLIGLALDQQLSGEWETFRLQAMGLMTPLRRLRGERELIALHESLAELRSTIANALESQLDAQKTESNDNRNGEHQSNSNTKDHSDYEPASERPGVKPSLPDDALDAASERAPETNQTPHEDPAFTLGLILEACPEVNHWATQGRVRSWPEFRETVALIRPMLGISPDAWAEARAVLGEAEAHIAVATILQRSEHASEARQEPGRTPGSVVVTVNGSPAIRSAGGYLRALTEQARAGAFRLGPVLMALIGQRTKARKAPAPKDGS